MQRRERDRTSRQALKREHGTLQSGIALVRDFRGLLQRLHASRDSIPAELYEELVALGARASVHEQRLRQSLDDVRRALQGTATDTAEESAEILPLPPREP
jgi:hypothetical protein